MNVRPVGLPESDRAVARVRRVRRMLGVALFELLAALLAVPLVGHSSPGPSMRVALVSTTEDRCASALEVVQGAGLVLPTGFEFRCPGDTRASPVIVNIGASPATTRCSAPTALTSP